MSGRVISRGSRGGARSTGGGTLEAGPLLGALAFEPGLLLLHSSREREPGGDLQPSRSDCCSLFTSSGL